MKTFFMVALTTSLFSPLAVMAQSFWLILQNSSYGIEKIEMKNMDQCQEQGKKYSKSSGIPRYLCLEGK